LYDWYKITIPADGKLVVNTTSDTTLEIDLFLYDINGTTQIASYDTAWGIREGTHYNNLMPGTYYVKAYCWGSKYGSYTISSIFTPTELINDTENNDSFPLAVNLPLNGNSSGHLGFYSNGYTDVYDWWKIIIPADGSLIVNTTSDKTLEIDLFMYSTDGTTQIASSDTSWGIHEATHYNSLIPGTYYVNAFSWGSGYGSYTISSLFSPQTGITNTLIPPDEVSVFPNPTFDKVTISSLGKITAIEIYNMLGEKVYAINNFKQQTSNGIDFSDFQKGIYFLKIYSGQKIQTKKIVLQ
jgi:hypothetical protein